MALRIHVNHKLVYALMLLTLNFLAIKKNISVLDDPFIGYLCDSDMLIINEDHKKFGKWFLFISLQPNGV